MATDIASRGIDVAGVSHVINFDVPNTPEAYTNRIGRTGRAERSGKAYMFVSREDAGALRAIERSLGLGHHAVPRARVRHGERSSDGTAPAPFPQTAFGRR